MAVRRDRVSSDSSCIAAFNLRREIVAECEAKRLDTTDLNHEEKRICVCIQNEPWPIKSGQLNLAKSIRGQKKTSSGQKIRGQCR